MKRFGYWSLKKTLKTEKKLVWIKDAINAEIKGVIVAELELGPSK